MRYILIILYLSFLSSIVIGQNTTSLQGVLSTKNGQEIPFANITIRELGNSQILQGTVSDDLGVFTFGDLSEGYYSIQSYYLGYEPLTKDSIWVKKGNNRMDTLKMRRKATQLEEITIVSEKALVENHPGMLVYNVGSGSNAGENALDVFKNIPSLGMDMDDNVTLKGAKATILIDGVESDLADMLGQLPSDVISSIEVISNPSAKYDSKNGGGIINIKLKDNQLSGFNQKYSVGYGWPKRYNVNAGVNITYKDWNFGLNASVKEDPKEDYRDVSRSIFSEKGDKHLKQKLHNHRVQQALFIRANARYRFSKLSNLTFQTLYQEKDAPLTSNYLTESYDADTILTSLSNNNREEENTNALLEFSGIYRKTFKNSKKHKLRAQLKYAKAGATLDYIRTSQPLDIETEEPLPSSSKEIRTGSDDNNSAMLKVDYELPVHKNWHLELGTQINYRRFEQEKISKKINYINVDEIKKEEVRDVGFNLDEIKPGLYAVMNGSMGKYDFSGGLRYEQTQITQEVPSLDSTTISNLTAWAPSFLLEKEVNERYTWGISYSLRNKMPNYRQLSPISLSFGGYYKNTGNPNLKSQQTQTLDFHHHLMMNKISLNGAIFYTHIDDLIGTYYSLVEEDGKLITKSQADNLGSMQNMGFEVSGSLPWGKLVFRPSITSYYKTLEGEKLSSSLDKEQWYTMLKLSANYSVNKKLSCQMMANYNGTDISVQGKRYQYYTVNLSAKYKLLKGKGLLSLKLNDIFDSYNYRKLINQREDQINNSYFNPVMQYVYVSFSYKLSTLKKKK
ncbi:outer membrane beta-barrel family protein [Labilibacter marinus]|uniref:outer membrane beta-barrel family protein n=1 Tax=Labilibacter marinus TaxID=1477105 RepID=UPI0013016065|nr:outer membrane beta-barrel family protein [Labilibacter marinus]